MESIGRRLPEGFIGVNAPRQRPVRPKSSETAQTIKAESNDFALPLAA